MKPIERVESAAVCLRADERVRALWLTGSLANGTGDGESDVDLRAAIRASDFATIGSWWGASIDSLGAVVWKRRWPAPPDEVITSALTRDYGRFDVIYQSASDPRPRSLGAARLLFDKDSIAAALVLPGAPASPQPLAGLDFVVEEFIRMLGMLSIVVHREDPAIGMEGQFGCHSLLIALLLMENGVDRNVMGKRRVAPLLSAEQREILAALPAIAPDVASIAAGRLAYARVFLPRARKLMEANGMAYPEALEAATRRHLRVSLGLEF